MTSPILNMLLGAALVTIGILVAALADRIRRTQATALEEEQPVERRRTPHSRPVPINPVPPVPPEITVFPLRVKKTSAPQVEAQSADSPEDVITALVAAGYKKQIATTAALACSTTERATVEDWTKAALRRCCARGLS